MENPCALSFNYELKATEKEKLTATIKEKSNLYSTSNTTLISVSPYINTVKM